MAPRGAVRDGRSPPRLLGGQTEDARHKSSGRGGRPLAPLRGGGVHTRCSWSLKPSRRVLVEVDLVDWTKDWAFALLFSVGPGSPVSLDPGRQFEVARNQWYDLVRLAGLAKDDLA